MRDPTPNATPANTMQQAEPIQGNTVETRPSAVNRIKSPETYGRICFAVPIKTFS
jgi:hypothetical protein